MLDNKLLKKLENGVKKDRVKQAMKRVLVKSKLSEVASVQEEVQNNQFNFSIDLKTLPVTDQQSTGRCWIFSALNFLRDKTAKKLNLESFEFSQSYIFFYDKLERINYFMESVKDFQGKDIDDRTLQFILSNGVQDGGQWQMFANLVKKYGLVPKAAFPETTSSSNSGLMNDLINERLRKYAYEVRLLHKEKKDSEIEKLDEKVLGELYGLLAVTIGQPPQKFDFEYVDKDKKYHLVQDLTPQKFYQEYVGVNLDDYVSVINSPTNDKPFYESFTVSYLGNVVEGDKVTHFNLPIERVKELVIAQLKDEELVWFGSDVGMYGSKEGVWDDKAYDFESVLGLDLEFDKGASLDYRSSAMNHAMVISGVNLVNELPTKWKIENSWGEKAGTKGAYMCSDTWFTKYVYQALINKKHLNEKELKALEKPAKVVNPWDPMGTLA